MLFQCWMLNMAIIGVALPGPPYISSQASIRRQRWLWGVSGRPSLFQSRRCVSLGQVLKDGGMPVSRLAFGPQVVIYAWTSKPRMMWARTLYICGLKKGTVYGHVCNDHAGGPSMWFSGLVYLSGSKSALKTCFRCCSNLLLGSKPSLNNKNDICELIELLCASRAGTCSRRPGQSLWRRLRWRGTLRVEHLPRSIFWDQKMDPKMGPPY